MKTARKFPKQNNEKMSALAIRVLAENMMIQGTYTKDNWRAIIEIAHPHYKNTKWARPHDPDYHVKHRGPSKKKLLDEGETQA